MNLENENGEITWDIKGFKAFSDLAPSRGLGDVYKRQT